MTDSVVLRAITRQMRVRGWRPVSNRSNSWTQRNTQNRITWHGGVLSYLANGQIRFMCVCPDTRTAGLILEAYRLLPAGVVENAQWFARPVVLRHPIAAYAMAGS